MESHAEAPLSDRVADWLRAAIIEGRLVPGQRVREDEVAAVHGVSRVPVREAVQKLAVEGFLELARFRGAVVAQARPERLRELIVIRQSLEALAARLAAQRRGDDQIEVLRATCDAAAGALDAEDFAALPDLVEHFHDAVAAASGNEELATMLGGVREKIRWIFSQDLESRSHQEWQDHVRILEAITEGDSSRAAKLMSQHIGRDVTVTSAHEPSQDPSPTFRP
jgi:DNA-binding GntR family transcriptional regulator